MDFVGVGEALRYQYQLEGVDTRWSEPKELHGVHYPGLEPGTYRFSVRAVNEEGVSSSQAAAVLFEIEAPFGRTWWFRLLIAAAVLVTLLLFHQMRVAKAVAVERIRHRIARDLHDDVGASLCHAALLSDLSQRETTAQNANARERLEQISSVCREALGSMSDIVWAIDPEKDKASDLAQRMRRFGEEMLISRGLQFHFSDGAASTVVLPPQVRHQMFLIFKEAIHNIVRHSKATGVSVELCVKPQKLTLRIADNGFGLLDRPSGNGNGLGSMSERATELGGSMEMGKSAKNNGTALLFMIPLKSVGR